VADLSLTMLNQVLEAALAFMILLLLMSVTAIVRVDTAVPATTETNANGEPAAAQNGRPTGVPTNALWAGSMAPPPMPARKNSVFGRGRYQARHVRGRMPKTRPPSPAGPPWGPAAPPPGLPRQGSERWI
jgi:hypothetical protein